MKVIALIGESDAGKTTTVNLLLLDLLQKGYHKELFHQIGGNKDDFKCILVKDGIRVGIATVGDFNVNKEPIYSNKEFKDGCRTFKEYIDDFKKDKCHKVILAISSNFNTENEIEDHLPTFNYKVYKEITENPNLQNAFNEADVRTILSLMNS